MSMTTHLRMLALTAAIAAFPAGAHAQSPSNTSPGPAAVEEARAHFNRGVDFFREGNYAAALIEFRRANDIAPNYRLLYNLGQTYVELHDYASALKAFEEYLARGGAEVAQDRRSEVQGEIRKLRARVAVLTVKSNVTGGDLLVDDVVIGSLPLQEPLLVSAGRRKVAIHKDGAVVATRTVDVAGGDAVTVDLNAATSAPAPSGAAPAAPPTTPPPATPPPPPASSGPGTGFWIALVATGVFAASTTVAGVMTLGAKNDFDSQLDTYPTSRSSVDDARDKTKHLALVTDILGGATLLAGAATIYFAASGPSTPGDSASRPGVGLVVGPSAAAIRARF